MMMMKNDDFPVSNKNVTLCRWLI